MPNLAAEVWTRAGESNGLGARSTALPSAALFGLSPPLSKRLLPNIGPMLLAGLLYLRAGAGLTIVKAVSLSCATLRSETGCSRGAERRSLENC